MKIYGQMSKGESQITEFSDSIMFSDLKLAKQVLTNFGSVLSKVEVNFDDLNENVHAEIIQSVNSIDSLVDLHLHQCKGNIFRGISKPFGNVKNLRLQGQLNTLKSATLQLNALFPALESLDVGYLYVSDAKSIEQKMPHLKHLHVEFLKVAFSESNIENLMKFNPQITSLKLRFNSPEFVQKVSKWLPNLEKFKFELKSSNAKSGFGPEIRLNNLKEAEIHSFPLYSPRKLQLKQLETLNLYFTGALSNSWIQFIAANSQLKSVRIHDGLVNDEQLLKLAGMDHLTDAVIGCDYDISIETVVGFLRKSPTLKTAYLKNIDKSTHDSLRAKLNGEWKLLSYNRRDGSDAYFMRSK